MASPQIEMGNPGSTASNSDGRDDMGAYEDLIEKLKQTDVVQLVLASLEKEPVILLNGICGEYEVDNEPVPDHLHVPGSLKKVALRELLSAGLLERQPGRRLSVWSYRPTSAGMKYYRRLVNEG